MNKFIDRHLENFLGPIAGATEKKADWEPFICFFDNAPFEGCTTYSTLGLSDHILTMSDGREVRLELVLTIESSQKHGSLPGMLIFVAEKILKSHRALLAGEVIRLIYPLTPGASCTDLYVTAPSIFPDGFAENNQTSPSTIFAWLIPITPQEADFVSANGWSKFEDLLMEKDPDLLNLRRPSIAP